MITTGVTLLVIARSITCRMSERHITAHSHDDRQFVTRIGWNSVCRVAFILRNKIIPWYRMLGTILLIILILIWSALCRTGHTAGWGIYPSGGFAIGPDRHHSSGNGRICRAAKLPLALPGHITKIMAQCSRS